MRRLIIAWHLYRDQHLAFTLRRAWRASRRFA